jgi:hypothetical protein
MRLQTFIYSNATGTYIGKAEAYVLAGSAEWQIKFIDTSTTGLTKIKFADGNELYDNILSNYLTLNYY